ncbi:MAG TPA: YSC84-related protein [Steroidobacteraceae bacterium]|nr:YSC84-related protein [Steroidobacteraceae bacterium]
MSFPQAIPFLRRFACVAAVAATALLPAAGVRADSAGDQRAQISAMAQQTLQALYAQKPSAERAIRESVGYAVFSDISTKIFVAGGGGGKGVAVNRITGDRTYMTLVTVSAGLGMGVSKSHLIWVFETPDAYSNFVNNGVELGADANLAVNPGAGGGLYDGAFEASPGAWLYQLSDAGLAAELTVQGSKYFKDSGLN